jgi:hypothetical protein
MNLPKICRLFRYIYLNKDKKLIKAFDGLSTCMLQSQSPIPCQRIGRCCSLKSQIPQIIDLAGFAISGCGATTNRTAQSTKLMAEI